MKDRSAGCLVAAVIAILVCGILAAVSFLYLARDSQAMESDTSMESVKLEDPMIAFESGNEEGAVVFKREELRRFSVPKAGEEITREHVVSFFIGEGTTELARSAFREAAEGASVSWLLRTAEVFEQDGLLKAHLQLPWQIKEGRSTSSSAIRVDAQFVESSRADLLKLRRGDWITVQGDLAFRGDDLVLKDARLVAERAE